MTQNTQNDVARFLLRITLGALVLLHGIAKLRGGLAGIQGMVVAHHWPAWLAYGVLLGEVIGPLMVLLGFFSRIGALLIAINMVFALMLDSDLRVEGEDCSIAFLLVPTESGVGELLERLGLG